MKFVLLLIFFLSTCVLLGFTQSKSEVRGHVLNHKKEAFSFVTVFAREKGKKKVISAAVCDQRGNFTLSLLQTKNYELEFSFAGFKKCKHEFYCDTVSPIFISNISMEKDTLLLGEVEIRPLLQINENEIVYNITADPDRETSNMKQMIEKIPTIHFDAKGKIVADDGEKIKITFNDKDDALLKGVPLKELLSKMPATGFSKVKILLKPSLKYGNVKYVVDLSKDKTKKLVGMVALPTLSYSLQNHSLSPSLTLSGSIDKLRFSATGKIDFISPPTSFYHRNLQDFEKGTELDQNQETETEATNYDNSLALSLDVLKKHYLGFGFSYNLKQSKLKSVENSVLTSSENSPMHSSAFKNSDSEIENWRIGFDYQFDFKKQVRSLHISAFVTGSPKEENIELGNKRDDASGSFMKQSNSISLRDKKLQLNYSDKFGKDLSFYSYLSYFKRKNVDEWESYKQNEEDWNESLDDYYRLNNVNEVLEGRTMFHYRINKNLNMSNDVSLNYPLVDQRKLLIYNEENKDYGNTDLLISSNNSLDVKFNKRCLLLDGFSITYDYSQLRPNAKQLSVNRKQVSEGYFQVGNPALDMEQMHSFGLSLQRSWMRPYFSFSFSNNRVGHVLYRNNEGNMIKTYANNSKYRNYRMALMKRFSIKRPREYVIVRFMPNYSKYNTAGEKTHSLTINASCTMNKNITKYCHVFMDLHYRKSFDSGYDQNSRSKPVWGELNLSYFMTRKNQPLAKITITTNPLGWGNSTYTNIITTEQYQQTTQRLHKRLPLTISIHFLIGKFKAESVRGFDSAKVTGFTGTKE